MDLTSYFLENHSNLFYFIAGISFFIELTVMGLSGPLLFFAIAAFITAVLSSFGIIASWEVELFTLGFLTALIALLMWKPLKNFQNRGDGKDRSSDMIGLSVLCAIEITRTSGAIRYSGINWTARLDEQYNNAIPEGELCEISAVEGNVMIVKPK